MGLRKPCCLSAVLLISFFNFQAVIAGVNAKKQPALHYAQDLLAIHFTRDNQTTDHKKKAGHQKPAHHSAAKPAIHGAAGLPPVLAAHPGHPAQHAVITHQSPFNAVNNQQLVVQSISRGWKFKKLADQKVAAHSADSITGKKKQVAHLNTNYYPAQVPGNIFTDLAANKLIGDIHLPANVKKMQWVEKADWEYKTTFKADAQLLAKNHINLEMQGLDTYARIYLNDSLVLRTNDMFTGWEIPVKGILKAGDNTLRIDFESALRYAEQAYQDLPYHLYAENDFAEKQLSMFTRKAAFQYGSEGGPRFVGAGIWKPVSLTGYNDVRIRSVHFRQNLLDAVQAKMTAIFELESADKENYVTIQIDCERAGLKHVVKAVSVPSGVHELAIDFDILKPQLWWPAGAGKPELYEIKASVRNADDHILDSVRHNIGLRTIELVNKADSTGKSFYFRVNGVPVFMKGATYVPQDLFPGKINRSKYEELFQSAIESNFNMLRVSGTGIYEQSLFYDLADSKGILIWQDFMFGGRMYPGDSSTLRTIRREAQYNIRRLRNHPCIAIWVGNSGIDKAWRTGRFSQAGGYKLSDSLKISAAYASIFENILPAQVKANDPSRFYLPSSGPYYASPAAARSNTDLHEWEVGRQDAPLETYKSKIGRFMSEYGFQAFPSLRTMHAYNLHIDDKKDSTAALKSGFADPHMLGYLENEYKLPLNFADFWYENQLMQGEALKMAIEAHRRSRNYCMGSLYYQFNESYPGSGYSATDFENRKKAAYFFAKTAFKPIMVSAIESKGKIKVYIVSDQLREINATLKIQFYTIEGDIITDKRMEVTVYPNTSHLYFTIDRKLVLKGLDSTTVYLKTSIEKEGEVISNNILYFAPVKNIPFEEPEISFQTQRAGKYFWLTVKSFRLAKNIFLDTKGTECSFSDNFFDLLPGESKIILVKPVKEIPDFGRILKIQTINKMVTP